MTAPGSGGPADGSTTLPPVGPLEQFVQISRFGIGFGLPKSWVTVQAKDIESRSPAFKKAAHRLHIAPEVLVQTLAGSGFETMSMDEPGANEGFPDNVSSVGIPGGPLTDGQIKERLAKLDARLGPLRHFSTPAGNVTAVTYVWVRNRALVYGQLLSVDLGGDAGVAITVSSSNSSRVGTIGWEVDRTLQRLSPATARG